MNDGQPGNLVPVGIAKIESYLYDIKLLNIDDERNKWEPIALWDLSYAHILYDPYGEVQVLIKEKLAEQTVTFGSGRSSF